MTHLEDLKGKAQELAGEARNLLAAGASVFIETGVASLEESLESAAAEVDRAIHDTLKPPRRIPWLGIAAGIGLVAGVIYLARHRTQRMQLEKTVKKGLQGGAVLMVRESARLWDKVPVRVVMK